MRRRNWISDQGCTPWIRPLFLTVSSLLISLSVSGGLPCIRWTGRCCHCLKLKLPIVLTTRHGSVKLMCCNVMGLEWPGVNLDLDIKAYFPYSWRINNYHIYQMARTLKSSELAFWNAIFFVRLPWFGIEWYAHYKEVFKLTNRQQTRFFPPNTSSLFFFLKLLYLTHAVSVGALKRYVQYCKEYFTNNELNTWIQLYKWEI